MACGILRYFLILTLTFFIGDISTDALRAEYALAKLLPNSSVHSRPFYDLNVSIYLFGGFGEDHAVTKHILRYDIVSDSIEEVAQMPSHGYGGSVQAIGDDIYFFGGYLPVFGYTDVVKFNPVTKTATSVASLPLKDAAALHTSFKQENSSIVYFLFPITGTFSRLYECDISTFTNPTVKDIVGFSYGFHSVVQDNYAFIFGLDVNQENQILKIDLDSFETETIPSHGLQRFGVEFPVVYNEVNVYILAGQDRNLRRVNDKGSLLQFNLATYEWSSLEIEDFPVNNDDVIFEYPPSGILVDKLSRIYYFRGVTYNKTSSTAYYSDDIWYIDISATNKRQF